MVLSLGLNYGTGRNDLRLGQPSLYEGNFTEGGYSIRWQTDTLDNLNLPTSGSRTNLVFRDFLTALGSDQDFQTLDLNLVTLIPGANIQSFRAFRCKWQAFRRTGRSDSVPARRFSKLVGLSILASFQASTPRWAKSIYMYRLTDTASAALLFPFSRAVR